jgi:hypothetical protein
MPMEILQASTSNHHRPFCLAPIPAVYGIFFKADASRLSVRRTVSPSGSRAALTSLSSIADGR